MRRTVRRRPHRARLAPGDKEARNSVFQFQELSGIWPIGGFLIGVLVVVAHAPDRWGEPARADADRGRILEMLGQYAETPFPA